jgi:hypothetical protein
MDNTTISLETTGDVIATDDIGGVKYQRMKMIVGADGVNDGDVSSTNPMPVSSGVYDKIEMAADVITTVDLSNSALLSISSVSASVGKTATTTVAIGATSLVITRSVA